jgi:hypothetical protein
MLFYLYFGHFWPHKQFMLARQQVIPHVGVGFAFRLTLGKDLDEGRPIQSPLPACPNAKKSVSSH